MMMQGPCTVSYEELATLAQSNGLTARNLNPVPSQDGLQRDDVKWVTVEVVRDSDCLKLSGYR